MVLPTTPPPPDLQPILSNTWFGGEKNAKGYTDVFDNYGKQVLALETVLTAFRKAIAGPEKDLNTAMKRSETARLTVKKTLQSLVAQEKKMSKDIDAFVKATSAGDSKKVAAMTKRIEATDKAHKKVMDQLEKQNTALHEEILKGVKAWDALKAAARVKEPQL